MNVYPFKRRGQLGVNSPFAGPSTNVLHGNYGYDPNIFTTPVYNPNTGNTIPVVVGAATPVTPGQSNIFNTIANLISQGFQTFGPHQSNQVVNGQIVANPGVLTTQAGAAASIASSQNARGTAAGNGGVAEDLFTSLGNIVQQHPLAVFGTIAVFALMFMKPPGRR
jgi:hypothetical protein